MGYVSEEAFATIKAKVKDGKEISKEDLDQLTFPDNLADDTMMIPVDMRGVEQEFDDVEDMIEKLGHEGAAKAFIKAREHFEANKTEDSAKPMTAAEWKELLNEDVMLEDGEEELAFEGEEEELLEEAEEEDGEGEEP